jgi:hypothetical protein
MGMISLGFSGNLRWVALGRTGIFQVPPLHTWSEDHGSFKTKLLTSCVAIWDGAIEADANRSGSCGLLRFAAHFRLTTWAYFDHMDLVLQQLNPNEMEKCTMEKSLYRIDAVLHLAKKAREEELIQLKKMMPKDAKKTEIISRFICSNLDNFVAHKGRLKNSELDAIYMKAKSEETFRWKNVSSFGSELERILCCSPPESEITILFSDEGYWKSQEEKLIAEPDWEQATLILSKLKNDVHLSKAGRLGPWERMYCREMPHVKVSPATEVKEFLF